MGICTLYIMSYSIQHLVYLYNYLATLIPVWQIYDVHFCVPILVYSESKQEKEPTSAQRLKKVDQ